MGEGDGSAAPDQPAGHGSRGLSERAEAANAVTPIEQHRRSAIGRGELQAPRRGLVGGLHFRNHAGKRPVAQPIFGQRQHVALLASLSIEDLVGAKPNLFQARGIEVEQGQRPKDREAGFRGKARGDAGDEQGRCRVIAQCLGFRCKFMECGAAQALFGQSGIDGRHAERQGRTAREPGMCYLGPKRGELLGARPRGGKRRSGHV